MYIFLIIVFYHIADVTIYVKMIIHFAVFECIQMVCERTKCISPPNRSRSESYWTAVVGEFDLTKSDPDEQIMKVNRIITHPKVNASKIQPVKYLTY